MSSEDLSEKETRNRIIDLQLARAGWNSRHYKEEVNPVKSDIKNGHYEVFSGKVEKNVDMFIDYLLRDSAYGAIVEGPAGH